MNTPNPSPETSEDALLGVLELFTQNRPDEAWVRLNEAVLAFPADARLRFLLGSVLAGQQEYTRALSQLEFAVQLDPHFEIARFQLGSLRFTSGDAEGARQAWQPLDALPDEHPLKCFKNGCEALMQDLFESAVFWLGQGIAANTENPHLNQDMQLLLQRTLEQINEPQVNAASDAGPTHLLISGYQSVTPEPEDLDSILHAPHHTRH